MSDKQRHYGVGIGPALRSRRVGRLSSAIRELRRLIDAGADPRMLTIVPVDRCKSCLGRGEFIDKDTTKPCGRCKGFKFKIIDPAPGIEPMAENRDALEADTYRCVNMSRPGTTAADRRSWLVKKTGEPSYLVRVYPGPEHGINPPVMVCDCKDAKAGKPCEHVERVKAADSSKYNSKWYADEVN